MAIPIVYLYFHSKILNWKGKEMSEKEFKSSFFQWRIPKTLRYVIMEEMQKMGLIKIEKRVVYLNNYYLNENGTKKKVDFKDGDTKVESPYLSFKKL